MLKLFLFIAFVADVRLVVASTAEATASATAGDGAATATATSGSTTDTADSAPTCGPDEYLDSCANGGCYDKRTCKDLDRNGTIICVDPLKCIPGCLCNKGLLRNKYGKCVPESKCPNSQCKEDFETYMQCTNCMPQTCDQLGLPLNCPTSNSSCIGKPGCYCIDGYVRDKTGKCIIKDLCPSCGGDKNAGPGCSNYCGNSCSDYNKVPVFCAQYCLDNGCACKKGHVYDDKAKKCVLPENCTPTCGPDEYLDSCANGGCYDKRTCKDLDRNGTIICVDPLKCIPGCLCNKGLLRNKYGKCVPENQCPNSQCKGDYEIYVQCNKNCMPQTCDQLGFPLNCTIRTSNSSCIGKPGCYCIDGYVRDKTGKCILMYQCPSCGGDKNAGPGCSNYCGNRCSDYNKGPVACPFYCIVNGCACKKGHVYDDIKKKCVLPENCSQLCEGANMEWDSCPDPCDPNTCESIGQKFNCPLQPADGKKCKGACKCKPGYYLNKIGQCISKENCLKCTKSFEYFSCGPACDNVCATLSQQNQTNCPIINVKCNDMCYCLKGYARNRQGDCVPISSCRNCPGKHEHRDDCPPICPPSDDCKTYKRTYACPLMITNDTSHCKPACRCEDNYLRYNGTCIPQEQCPCDGDKNATRQFCGCSRTCSDFLLNKQPNCTECNLNTCECKDGYVLDEKSGKCVLPEDCPVCPGKHEKYDLCPSNCAPTDGCETYNKAYSCPAIIVNDTSHCKPACRCENGYLRLNGTCIPEEQCPCDGDENSKPGCGCSRTCSDFILNKPPTCTKICKINACDCKDGYFLDEETGKCVHPKDCPVTVTCPKGQTLGCGDNCNRKCVNFRHGESPYACPRLACSGIGYSCQCDPSQGYYWYDKLGKCVPSCECPP